MSFDLEFRIGELKTRREDLIKSIYDQYNPDTLPGIYAHLWALFNNIPRDYIPAITRSAKKVDIAFSMIRDIMPLSSDSHTATEQFRLQSYKNEIEVLSRHLRSILHDEFYPEIEKETVIISKLSEMEANLQQYRNQNLEAPNEDTAAYLRLCDAERALMLKGWTKALAKAGQKPESLEIVEATTLLIEMVNCEINKLIEWLNQFDAYIKANSLDVECEKVDGKAVVRSFDYYQKKYTKKVSQKEYKYAIKRDIPTVSQFKTPSPPQSPLRMMMRSPPTGELVIHPEEILHLEGISISQLSDPFQPYEKEASGEVGDISQRSVYEVYDSQTEAETLDSGYRSDTCSSIDSGYLADMSNNLMASDISTQDDSGYLADISDSFKPSDRTTAHDSDGTTSESSGFISSPTPIRRVVTYQGESEEEQDEETEEEVVRVFIDEDGFEDSHGSGLEQFQGSGLEHLRGNGSEHFQTNLFEPLIQGYNLGRQGRFPSLFDNEPIFETGENTVWEAENISDPHYGGEIDSENRITELE